MKACMCFVVLFLAVVAYGEPNAIKELDTHQDWVKSFKEQMALGGIWNGRFIEVVLDDVDDMFVRIRLNKDEVKKLRRLEPDLVPIIQFFKVKMAAKVFQHIAERDKILLTLGGEIVALEISGDDEIHSRADGEYVVLNGILRKGNYQYVTTNGSINTVPLYIQAPRDIIRGMYYSYVYKCGIETDFIKGMIEHNECPACKGVGKINVVENGKIVGKTTCSEIFKNPVYKQSMRKIYEKRWEVRGGKKTVPVPIDSSGDKV